MNAKPGKGGAVAGVLFVRLVAVVLHRLERVEGRIVVNQLVEGAGYAVKGVNLLRG